MDVLAQSALSDTAVRETTAIPVILKVVEYVDYDVITPICPESISLLAMTVI